ncbi:oligosaccharide flippase family protein [Paenibacillus sp. FSL R7-0652]|uniref:Oligosaccharide flippase family protein n=1 Tax=Paenibacillus sp. AN1007 TaxID=3151385 RepID=A0AAU8N8M7_9BACL
MSSVAAPSTRQFGLLHTILMTSFANILIMAVTTLTSILTARMFGAEGRGELAAVLFWPSFLSGLAALGLPTSLIFNVKRNQHQLSTYIGMSFAIQVPISVIVGCISWYGVSFWLGGYSESIIVLAQWYTVLMVPLLLLMGVLAASAQGTERFIIYNLSRLLVPCFNLIGLLILWISGTLTVERAVVTSLISTLIVLGMYMYMMRTHIFESVGTLFRQFKAGMELFNYGVRVYGVELLGTLYTQFDKIIIITLLTPRDFGLYSVVFALSRMFDVVQNAIANVIFPKVAGKDKDQVLSLVGRAFRISIFLMTLIVVPSMFIGRYFIGLFYGEEFLQASTVFYLLSFECIIGGGSWILASAFNALGRPGVILLRQICALAVTVTLFFILTPTFGLNGIGVALLAGAMVRILMSLISISLLFKLPMRRMLYNKEDIVFLRRKFREKNPFKGAGKDAERAADSSHE